MAIFTSTVDLPITNNASIATFANANAGKLVLPATGLLVEYDGTINFIKLGYSSSLSITSANDLRAITFSVYGINNGYYVTEKIVGPNSTTISTNYFFEKIISITISGNITGPFTLGSGRDVAVYSYLPMLKTSSSLPSFTCTVNSPTSLGLDTNKSFIIAIADANKVLLDRTKINVTAYRQVSYEIIRNGFTETMLKNGANFTFPAQQSLFVAIKGSLVVPVFYSNYWSN